jgi:hypothetical protein
MTNPNELNLDTFDVLIKEARLHTLNRGTLNGVISYARRVYERDLQSVEDIRKDYLSSNSGYSTYQAAFVRELEAITNAVDSLSFNDTCTMIVGAAFGSLSAKSLKALYDEACKHLNNPGKHPYSDLFIDRCARAEDALNNGLRHAYGEAQ